MAHSEKQQSERNSSSERQLLNSMVQMLNILYHEFAGDGTVSKSVRHAPVAANLQSQIHRCPLV